MKNLKEALLHSLESSLILADEIEEESCYWNEEAVANYNKLLDDLQNARSRLKKLM